MISVFSLFWAQSEKISRRQGQFWHHTPLDVFLNPPSETLESWLWLRTNEGNEEALLFCRKLWLSSVPPALPTANCYHSQHRPRFGSAVYLKRQPGPTNSISDMNPDHLSNLVRAQQQATETAKWVFPFGFSNPKALFQNVWELPDPLQNHYGTRQWCQVKLLFLDNIQSTF